VQVVNADTLQDVEDVCEQPTLVAVAAFFGSVRLIDNMEL
jgi:pantothenate synthetase